MPRQWNALVEKWNGSFFITSKHCKKKKHTNNNKQKNTRTVCMTFCRRMPVTANIAVIYLIVFVTVRASKRSTDVFVLLWWGRGALNSHVQPPTLACEKCAHVRNRNEAHHSLWHQWDFSPIYGGSEALIFPSVYSWDSMQWWTQWRLIEEQKAWFANAISHPQKLQGSFDNPAFDFKCCQNQWSSTATYTKILNVSMIFEGTFLMVSTSLWRYSITSWRQWDCSLNLSHLDIFARLI